ncbi:MAG: hypothetical protein HC767_00140 [Akkermansiaceae bacterium]|nr:hypothetical protein [Akkermansiaceae bacterium]
MCPASLPAELPSRERVELCSQSKCPCSRSDVPADLVARVAHCTNRLDRNGIVCCRSSAEAIAAAEKLGFPVMVRPSYVLGGRAMEIVYDNTQLDRYLTTAVKASPDHPVLVDKYLAGATHLLWYSLQSQQTSASLA